MPHEIKADEIWQVMSHARDTAIREQCMVWVYIDPTARRPIWMARRETDIPATALIVAKCDWNFSPYRDQLVDQIAQKDTVLDEVAAVLSAENLRMVRADNGRLVTMDALLQRIAQARAGTLNLHDKEDDDDESHD